MSKRTAIIIGAGPAGLTAAFELLTRTDWRVVVLEQEYQVGGLSRTVVHGGNRMDLGGHRFFTKSARVMAWWTARLPVQGAPARDEVRPESGDSASPGPGFPDPEVEDRVLLVRRRLSRILFLGKFFDYPLSLSARTLGSLGLGRTLRIALSYLRVRGSPLAPVGCLEPFFINRFGRDRFTTFVQDYPEQAGGTPRPPHQPGSGAQRIQGLSIAGALTHALGKVLRRGPIPAKERSLQETFHYPKLGPGQMWETVAEEVQAKGGEVRLGQKVLGLDFDGQRVRSVRVLASGRVQCLEADLVLSTLPLQDLVAGLEGPVPQDVREVAAGLMYRDFITVGLLVDRLRVEARGPQAGRIPDTWLYIQEPEVKLGRVQVFNNWSPYLVADPSKVWLGLEYFCTEGDALWTLTDEAMIDLATQELARIQLADPQCVREAVVIRVPKAYPAYFGTYDRLDRVRAFLDGIPNLYLLGRNGMHRYNNQDHSMLAAMTLVDNLVEGRLDRTNIWAVNTEGEPHES